MSEEKRNNDLNSGDNNGGGFEMQEQDHRDHDHREDEPRKEEEFQDNDKHYQYILKKAEDFKHIQLQKKEDRAYIMACVDDIEFDARVLAGMAIALGKKETVVWQAYLQEMHDGAEVRQILFDWINKVETRMEKSEAIGKKAANGAGYGPVSESEFEPVGFFSAEAAEDCDEVHNDGSRSKLDLQFLKHVKPALQLNPEARKARRGLVIDHPNPRAIIEMYYSEVGKTTIFNSASLLNFKSSTGNKLAKTGALPLSDGVLPGAMDKPVINEVIDQKLLTKTEETALKNLQNEQSIMRNIAFRQVVPNHQETCDLVAKLEGGEFERHALAPMLDDDDGSEFDLTFEEQVSRMRPEDVAYFMKEAFKHELMQQADRTALLLHTLFGLDISFQKQTLIMNESGEASVVREVYHDEVKIQQKIAISEKDRAKLDPGPAARAVLKATQDAVAASKGGKRKSSTHRTPPQDNKKFAKQAPRAPFKARRNIFDRLGETSNYEAPATRDYNKPYEGRGRGRGRGRGEGGRGRGFNRGGFPEHR
jgi:hypothetical protein